MAQVSFAPSSFLLAIHFFLFFFSPPSQSDWVMKSRCYAISANLLLAQLYFAIRQCSNILVVSIEPL
jgi:hypothetical protein